MLEFKQAEEKSAPGDSAAVTQLDPQTLNVGR